MRHMASNRNYGIAVDRDHEPIYTEFNFTWIGQCNEV